MKASGNMSETKKVKTVNILGTDYKVIRKASNEDYPQLEQCNGFTDCSVKLIVVAKFDEDEMSMKDLEWCEKKTLRHEIIHAFLFESGLGENSTESQSWATNEEMVDFFAIQFPKILSIYEELQCLK